MTFILRSQRDAVAFSFGWDRDDVDEYQPTRPRDTRTRLWNVGDGFGIAVKAGKPVPTRIAEEFGPWRLKESVPGWDIYLAGNV